MDLGLIMKSHKDCLRNVKRSCRDVFMETRMMVKPESLQAFPTAKAKVYRVIYRGATTGEFVGCCAADARNRALQQVISAAAVQAQKNKLAELEDLKERATKDGLGDHPEFQEKYQRAKKKILGHV